MYDSLVSLRAGFVILRLRKPMNYGSIARAREIKKPENAIIILATATRIESSSPIPLLDKKSTITLGT